ncbi:3-deoxy-D-arabinoheptulosonate-7-phosphate synthase [Kushneria sinocarnis]|uniref:Phospho-2-dehydro-3-deoxyheptonate aldolase n=1 Tax=Kushneria sinocarnis TaxID=595502 RepID=A0A420WXM4_9GAMM|nr:3-deoxy-7-phosphoheptulonate synthase [Kushneria sinocarnis]RKR04422.1 3-deoxy-D-arabinoheptulosonate-7-phosphate synthase [Kushneria sinocarnis]
MSISETTPATTAASELPARRTRCALPSSAELKRELPLADELTRTIAHQRSAIRDIIHGRDDRLLVVTGPCSIHDEHAAMEYARHLQELAARVGEQLLPVMRVYIEKPRTTVGWKGFAYDPDLDGRDDMAGGLWRARRLMRDIVALGVPVATELLQPMTAPYIDDLVSWAAIGARTTESQIHRELASGFPAPVGFKNGTDGGIGVALDAMAASAHGHRFFGVDEQGGPAVIETAGNPDTQLVLRGGHQGPNCDPGSIEAACRALEHAGHPPSLMVDCSHANSGKDPFRQPEVFEQVIEQRLAGQQALTGVMIESHLEGGRQPMGGELQHGVSITDGCLDWAQTRSLLLAAAERLARAPSMASAGAEISL